MSSPHGSLLRFGEGLRSSIVPLTDRWVNVPIGTLLIALRLVAGPRVSEPDLDGVSFAGSSPVAPVENRRADGGHGAGERAPRAKPTAARELIERPAARARPKAAGSM